MAAGDRRVNEYESFVFYHNNTPKWTETFKVGVASGCGYSHMHKFMYEIMYDGILLRGSGGLGTGGPMACSSMLRELIIHMSRDLVWAG